MTFCFRVEAPHRWVQMDRHGALRNQGSVDALAELPLPQRGERLLAVVPGDAVTVSTVSVPARSRAKALAAVPFALEESLAADVDELAFTLLDWKPGASATVAITSRAQMEAWNAELHQLPRPVDLMLPEYLLLPLHPQARYTVATTEDSLLAVRSGPVSGLMLDPDSLELWWQELDDTNQAVAVNDADIAKRLVALGGTLISEWRIGHDFTQWVEHGFQPPSQASLLQGRYRPDHQRNAAGGLKVAAGLMLLALLVRVGADGYEYFKLSERSRDLDRRILATFNKTFPEVTRIVNPRLQMEQQVKRLRAGATTNGQFQMLLAAVAQAVPASNAKLEEVTYRDELLLITCTTADFAGLDRLKQRFGADQRIRAELLSSGSRDNRVSGRFRLNRAG